MEEKVVHERKAPWGTSDVRVVAYEWTEGTYHYKVQQESPLGFGWVIVEMFCHLDNAIIWIDALAAFRNDETITAPASLKTSIHAPKYNIRPDGTR